jgi:hypothetical protein
MLTAQLGLKPKVKEFLEGKIELFIESKFVPSVSGKTFETLNPATEERSAGRRH